MKRVTLFISAVVLFLALGSATVSAQEPAADPFIGIWYSIDAVDESHQKLSIQRAWRPGTYWLVSYDDGASACGCDPTCPAYAYGLGRAEDGVLTARLSVVCLGRPVRWWGRITMTYTHQADTDTLVDDTTTSWQRFVCPWAP